MYTVVEDADPNTATGDLRLGNGSNERAGTFTIEDTPGQYGNFALSQRMFPGGVVQTRTALFTYTLNNDNAAVNGLDDGETLTETFTVEANQTSGPAGNRGAHSATITINIQGSTDPTRIVAPGSDPDALTGAVFEDGSRSALSDSDEVQVTRGVVTNLLLVEVTDMPTTYGTFTTRPEDSSGLLNQWIYTLDNTNPAVDALNDGETLTDTFTLTAADDGTTPATAVVTITIRGATDSDRTPTFGTTTITPQTYAAGTAVSVTLPTATDGNGTLSYAITATLPDGLTFTPATRVLDGTPTTGQAATTYTYTVTDADANQAATDADTLSFTIAITDLMPTFGATTIADQTYLPETAITDLTLPEATGGDGTLTYTLTPDPPTGLTFDDTTRVLSGTTPTTEQRAVPYTYTATDNDADPARLTFTITIADDPPEVVFAGGPRMTVDEGAMVTLDATGSSDPAGQAVTFLWTVDATNEVPVTLSDTTAAAPTFTAPEERTRLTFTLTVSDNSTPPNTATATLTVQVGRSSERALQKTLAAFGGAFAAGTVGVFEDYLSTPAGRANTSHFTIGGHKFDLAAVGTGRDLSTQTPPSFPNTPTPSFPNDRKTGSDSDHVFHRIGNPANTTTMSAKDLLMKSAFHFNLNDDATATSGWSLWARATTTNFDGKPEDDFDLDGDVTSAYLGMDYQTPTGTRLGLAISETSGEVDYDDATDEAQGDLDADLTSILPYIQWQANDTTTAWAMLGYGEGDAELATDGDDETTDVDIEMQMIALGVSGDLTTYKRSEWSWKASAFAVELESEADEATDLPAVDANAQRLRAAIQGRVPGQTSATGTQFTPNWELGLRWDDGDAEQGGGADVGLGFNYTNPVNGLSVQGKTSFLVAHEAEDYEEWEASLQARLDSGVQGRGITFTLEPAWTADGRSQKMGMDFSNALGKWSKRGLRLELTGERTERDDDNIGHNIRLTGTLRF